MPRRFGLGTVLVVTTLFALLFGVARITNAPLEMLAVYTSFVVVVGLSQIVLAKSPRLASAAAGAIFCPATVLIGLVYERTPYSMSPADFQSFAASGQLVWLMAFGALLGYVGGTVIAGLFLVLDVVDRSRRRLRVPRAKVPSGAP